MNNLAERWKRGGSGWEQQRCSEVVRCSTLSAVRAGGCADRSEADCERKERGKDHCAMALAEHWKMARTTGGIGLEAWFWM